jgi:uncharacterized cupredoxin-like copper-binding protein
LKQLLFGLALLTLACPGGRPEDSSQNAPAKTTTTTQSPQAVPENSTAMNPVAPHSPTEPSASPSVDVHLIEYEIHMSETLNAGPQSFRVANGGKEQHSLAIEGPGVSQQLGSNLTGGSTAELALTLQPGTYTVWCPVKGHRGKGMQRTITVK